MKTIENRKEAMCRRTLSQEISKMLKHREKIVNAINHYIEDCKVMNRNPSYECVVGNGSDLDNSIEGLAMFSAWIEDRLNGLVPISGRSKGNRDYNKSRRKKIRKAYGYIF